MNRIRVLCYGVGVVGGMIAKSLLEKDGVEIVGAVDVARDKVGKDLGQVLGLTKEIGVTVSNDLDSLPHGAKADVAVHATSSYLKDTGSQIASLVEHGFNVVSTCEELSYPFVSEPELAAKIDRLAKKCDVTVLGTGINPGFPDGRPRDNTDCSLPEHRIYPCKQGHERCNKTGALSKKDRRRFIKEGI